MRYNFIDINDSIRELMCDEVDIDYNNGKLNYLLSFIQTTTLGYSDILKYEFRNGNEISLGEHFSRVGVFRTHFTDVFNKDGKPRKVNKDIHISKAEDEFNRYYIRAICKKSIECENADVQIYRAKDSETHRPESDLKIGNYINAQSLLDDLRNNVGKETQFELPEYKSGLSVKLI